MKHYLFYLIFLSVFYLFGNTEPAIDFLLKDSHGKSHQLSQYKGNVVVLEWVNYDCPFVKKFYRSQKMQQLQNKYRDLSVVWLSICSSAKGKQGYFSGEQLNKRIKKENAKPNAYLIDSNGKVGRMYQAKTTPHFFIIDKNFKLAYQGAIDSIKSFNSKDIQRADNYISKTLDLLLQNKEIQQAKTTPYGCSVKY